MNAGLAAQQDLAAILRWPMAWGLMVGAVGLAVILSNTAPRRRLLGKFLAAAGLVVIFIAMPKLSPLADWMQWGRQVVFWLCAGAAVACAGASITAHNPVYTAIWFAGSLLGVAGLFLYQQASFLGVATVVVYAGAIVVTFLFVLMLANPGGQARYDRVSWSKSVVPAAIAAGLALILVVARSADPPPSAPAGVAAAADEGGLVRLGTELFARHLVEVEVAGTLLLIALVGAVAIVIHGRDRRAGQASRAAAGGGGTQP